MTQKKSQVISLDFLIAVSIFVLIFAVIIWSINTVEMKKRDIREYNELIMLANQATDTLIYTSGSPQNWYNVSANEIKSIGILDGNSISSTKIQKLKSLNYTTLKQKLGILGPNYDIGISISQFNGAEFENVLNAGKGSKKESTNSIIINKNIIIDNSPANLEVTLSKNGICIDNSACETNQTCIRGSCNTNVGAFWNFNKEKGNIMKGQVENSIKIFEEEYLELNTTTSLHQGNYTISTWVYPTSWGNATENEKVIISDINNKTIFLILSNSSFFGQGTGWGIGAYSGVWYGASSGDDPFTQLNKWTHVVGTYNGTSFKIYVNGVMRNSSNFVGVQAAGNIIRISYQNNSDPLKFNGSVDEIRIYNNSLTNDEIYNLYLEGINSQKSNPNTNLTLEFNFNKNFTNSVNGTQRAELFKNQTFAFTENESNINGSKIINATCYNETCPDIKKINTKNKLIEFDGKKDKLKITNDTYLLGTNPSNYSISIWFNPYNSTTNQTLISCQYSSSSYDASYTILTEINTNSYPYTINYKTKIAGTENTISSPINISTWNNAVFVFRRNNYMKLYINGVLTNTTAISSSSDYTDDGDCHIGITYENGIWDKYFYGQIDDIAIMNEILSDSKIAQMYDAGKV